MNVRKDMIRMNILLKRKKKTNSSFFSTEAAAIKTSRKVSHII